MCGGAGAASGCGRKLGRGAVGAPPAQVSLWWGVSGSGEEVRDVGYGLRGCGDVWGRARAVGQTGAQRRAVP